MLRIEEDVFSNFREAVYWAVVTLTTIGYGDMSPATWQGQLFFIFYSMLGVAILSSFLSIIAQSAVSDAIEYAEYSSESGVEAKVRGVECVCVSLLSFFFLLSVGTRRPAAA